jgi:alpha-galactosidase
MNENSETEVTGKEGKTKVLLFWQPTMRIPGRSFGLFFALFSCAAEAKNKKTVKIFILAGDDNVEGFASIPHLHQLCTGNHNGTHTAPRNATAAYQHLIAYETGRWAVRDDVFVTYDHHRTDEWLRGPLTVQGFGSSVNTFGPEVEFGHVVGNMYREEPVVLIKAGWKQRSLAKDFRPPSASSSGGDGAAAAGFQWFRLLRNIDRTVTGLHEILGPAYLHAHASVEGLVWWHGYSDLRNTDHTRAYGENLAHFMRDIRAHLRNPALPIVIAELGGRGRGSQVTDQERMFRALQQKIASLPEFNFTTRFVPTAAYAKTQQKRFDENLEHYYGRADTMVEISRALATTLGEMLFDGQGGNWEDWNNRIENNVDVIASSGMGRIQFILMGLLFLVGAVAFVIFRKDGFSINSTNRTWNTAINRFRPSNIEHSEEEGNEGIECSKRPAVERI